MLPIYKISKGFKPRLCAGVVLSLIAGVSFGQTIKIHRNTIISSTATYENVNLDMSDGSFIVKNNGVLNIKNCDIEGTLSKEVPILISVDNGKLNLENNRVSIKAHHLSEHPRTQSLEYVMSYTLGELNLNGNSFKIDKPFTAGLLVTTASIATTGFKITNNQFEKFHGVLYLIASDNSLISDNTFTRNSYGHIVLIGNNSKIIHNSIYFSGNDHLGNSMDIIDSSNVTISKNIIFTPTCHGIYVLNSQNMIIDGNTITGGITYAMNVLTFPETIVADDDYVAKIAANLKFKYKESNNIRITNNYMSQNRYGIAVSDSDRLFIKDNYFSQRFDSDEARKFWTNNDILMHNVTNLTWVDNLYKESFTQAIDGDNVSAQKFVTFPKSGGVVL